MNLPASAVEFLDALAGAFTGEQWARRSLPLIHCYAFLRDNETEDALRKVRPAFVWCCEKAANDSSLLLQRVETALGGGVEEEWRVVPVRDVAPHKTMVCVIFRAPSWLRNELASRREGEERDERCSKRSKEQ
jgi:tRNA (guanine37-N1)-methyltransferase